MIGYIYNIDRESQNAENEVASEESQPFSGNIPLSQI